MPRSHELVSLSHSYSRASGSATAPTSSEVRASLQRLLDRDGGEASISDAVTEIEGGFLFRFPQVTYRVIGSFAEHTTRMKANIKAQLDQSAPDCS